MVNILDKYQNNPNFNIDSYLTDKDFNMDIKMVKFNKSNNNKEY